MRFTRTRLSDIVRPVSSSQLTQDPDRVRSFGGYDTSGRAVGADKNRFDCAISWLSALSPMFGRTWLRFVQIGKATSKDFLTETPAKPKLQQAWAYAQVTCLRSVFRASHAAH